MAEIVVHIRGEDSPRRFSQSPEEVKAALDKKFAQIRNFASTARGDINTIIDSADSAITDPENRKVFGNLILKSNPIEKVRQKVKSFMEHTPYSNPLEGGVDISAGDIANVGLDIAPGTGDVIAASDFNQAIREGDVGQAALAGVGLLPFIPGVAGVTNKLIGDGASKLPMDEASRMARAKELGFYTGMPLYHGTKSDIDEFKLPTKTSESVSRSPVGTLGVSLATEPGLANEFASRAGGEGMNVIPAYHRADRPVSIDLDGTETNEEIFATVSDAWEKGFDSIKFNNYTTKDGGSGQSFILVKDPSQVRSKFAQFDPLKKMSPSLLAGSTGAVLLSKEMMSSNENEGGM